MAMAMATLLPQRRLRATPSVARRWSCLARAEKAPDLIEWVKQQGGYVWEGVQVTEDRDLGLGLIATESLTTGSRLISLPPKSHLFLSDASSSPSNAALVELARRLPEELWSLKLGLKLLSEKAKERSFWWPYIATLPQRFDTPIFFSADEIAGLQYLPLVQEVKKRCKYLIQLSTTDIPTVLDHLPLNEHPFGGQHVDAGALGWAMSAASSRAFQSGSPNNSIGRSLMPLIDMCNHSFSPNCQVLKCGMPLGNFEMYARQNLEEGTPLTLNYGDHNNSTMLLDYGFIDLNNPHNTVDINLNWAAMDFARMSAGFTAPCLTSPAPWQQQLIKSLPSPGNPSPISVGGPQLVDGRLLASLRILFCNNPSDIQSQGMEKLKTWGSDPPLGKENEVSVLETLVTFLELLIPRAFGTTAEEDMAALAKPELPRSQRLVIESRLDKKKNLLDTKAALTSKIQALRTIALALES